MAHSGQMIYMSNVPGKPDWRRLTIPLPIIKRDGTWGEVPAGFEWDGSSVPAIFQGVFPRHKHPIASCRHDWRCNNTTGDADRAFADAQFKEDVASTSWWITAQVGYLGVRIGAMFGSNKRSKQQVI